MAPSKWISGLKQTGHFCTGNWYSYGGLIDNLQGMSNLRKYAVDINERSHSDDIAFYRYDCNNGLPDFDGATFDIVFAGEVIEHIFDDEMFLKVIYDKLNKGGILILTVPHLFFLVNRILFPFGKMPYFAYAPFHYHFYSVNSIKHLVEIAGFTVRGVQSSHILISSRRNKLIGMLFEFLGNIFPRFGAHLIIYAEK